MCSTTSKAVIEKLKQIFARHGVAETVKSDNGPQYSPVEFATSLQIGGSPKYPKSNGLVREDFANCQENVGESQA